MALPIVAMAARQAASQAAKQGAEQAAKQGAEQAAEQGAEQAAEQGASQAAKQGTSEVNDRSLSPQQVNPQLSRRFSSLEKQFESPHPDGANNDVEKQLKDLHNTFQQKMSDMKPEPRAKLVEEIEGFLNNASSGLQHTMQTATHSAGQLLGQAEKLAGSLNNVLQQGSHHLSSQLENFVKSAADTTHPDHQKTTQFLKSLSSEATHLNTKLEEGKDSLTKQAHTHLTLPKMGHGH